MDAGRGKGEVGRIGCEYSSGSRIGTRRTETGQEKLFLSLDHLLWHDCYWLTVSLMVD